MNYNAGAYLDGAVRSLARQTYRDFEVIVWDNASCDGSVEDLDLSGLPSVSLERCSENLGFAAANNRAAGRAKGDWLVLLNPDAKADEAWLAQVADGIKRYPGMRAFASLQTELDRPGYMDGAGDAYLVFGFAWRGGFGQRLDTCPPEGLCFSPCGAGAVIERAAFARHGGFEESFFCYNEDVDLGFRMQMAGDDCVFLPGARIAHKGSAVSGRHSAFSIYHGTRNRIWTYARLTPGLLLALTLPAHLALSVYLLVRHSLIGQSGAAFRGLRDGIGGALGQRRAARAARKRRRLSVWQLARRMAWNPLTMSARRPHIRPVNTGDDVASTAPPQSTSR